MGKYLVSAIEHSESTYLVEALSQEAAVHVVEAAFLTEREDHLELAGYERRSYAITHAERAPYDQAAV